MPTSPHLDPAPTTATALKKSKSENEGRQHHVSGVRLGRGTARDPQAPGSPATTATSLARFYQPREYSALAYPWPNGQPAGGTVPGQEHVGYRSRTSPATPFVHGRTWRRPHQPVWTASSENSDGPQSSGSLGQSSASTGQPSISLGCSLSSISGGCSAPVGRSRQGHHHLSAFSECGLQFCHGPKHSRGGPAQTSHPGR